MSNHQDPDIFLQTQQPWWFMRCTHREHSYHIEPDGVEYGCWRVLREAEGVVALHLRCLDRVHVLVDRPGLGSVCKTMITRDYLKLDESELLTFVQDQLLNLRQSLA